MNRNTEKNTPDSAVLEGFFQAAKAAQPQPDLALMNRILLDATAVQKDFQRPVSRKKTRIWQDILEALGGWKGVSALTTCACAGLWIGFAAPETVTDFSAGLITIADNTELDYGDLYGLQDLLTEISG